MRSSLEEIDTRFSQDEAHPVVLCLGCGKEIVTPVPPPDYKKLLCMECFNRIEVSKEEI
jgi:hypothetical protein